MPPTLIKRKQNLYTPFLTANKGIIQTSHNMSLVIPFYLPLINSKSALDKNKLLSRPS